MIDRSVSSENHEPAATTSLFNGVELATRIMPAAQGTRGADWCEVFTLTEDVVALSIGDVCGHGSEKFATMVDLRQAIRDAAFDGCDPSSTLACANAALKAYDPGETATAYFALLDTRKRTLTFANAGHPPPIMIGPLGSLFIEYADTDIPLGVADSHVATVRTLNTPPATLFVFYTDGVTDRERSTVNGTAQLRAAAEAAYLNPGTPAAAFIEQKLLLMEANSDDAAILTARTPLMPIERPTGARRKAVNGLSRIALDSAFAARRALRD
jgi:serine phosphatase RsbU (regulator of sigma subunit)